MVAVPSRVLTLSLPLGVLSLCILSCLFPDLFRAFPVFVTRSFFRFISGLFFTRCLFPVFHRFISGLSRLFLLFFSGFCLRVGRLFPRESNRKGFKQQRWCCWLAPAARKSHSAAAGGAVVGQVNLEGKRLLLERERELCVVATSSVVIDQFR